MAHLQALLPKADVLATWEDVETAMEWAKVPEDMLKQITIELGEEELPDMAVLAAVEVADMKHAMHRLNITALKRTRVNLLMNALRSKFALPLLDYTKAEVEAQKVTEISDSTVDAIGALIRASQSKATEAGSTITVAHVLDQASSEQLVPLPDDEVDKLRQVLHDKLDGEPLEGEAFTDAQVTAFKKRIDGGGSPACDYSVLGPYGNRMERNMKFMATFRDSSGQERTVEVAGPDTVDTWEQCHQVFKNLSLACSVAKSSTLDNYRARFKERCSEFAGQWGLAMAAEQTCRFEHWPRLKSQHKRLYDNPDTRAFSLYDPAMPWESAISASITDIEYWGRYFERKALKALASPRPGNPIHAAPEDGPAPGKVRKLSRRDQARQSGDGKRPDGRLYWDGQTKFCAEYHLYNGCEWQCPHSHSHRCEFCKGWHRSSNCPQKPQGWTPPERPNTKGKGNSRNDKGGKGKKGGSKQPYRSW